MDEQYRIENPLGFQVTSYRVDSDYASTPPEETPGAEAADDGATDTASTSSESSAPIQPSPIPDDAGAETAPRSDTQGVRR
jgi:type IV secretion system protein VirB8